MKHLQFFRVQYCNGRDPFLISSQATLSELYLKIKQKLAKENIIIYYHFKPHLEQQHGKKKLKQIVDSQPAHPQPIFIVYDIIKEQQECPFTNKYGQALSEVQKTKQPPKQYSQGSNGMVLFDNRHTSLLASSINQATSDEQYTMHKKNIVENFNQIVVKQNQSLNRSQSGLIKNLLSKIGLIKKQLNLKNIINTIQTIKNIKTKQQLVQHIDREYSDYDPKFAAYLQSIYLRYGFINGYRMHYIDYKNMHDGVIKYKFPSNAKIAIIGDYGTGMSDSIGLLRHAIIDKEVDIILHLGDVYYAGTPNQYKNHVLEPLNKLRKQAGYKFKKQVLFYSIPGNHDYYTWGMPFLCFLASVNDLKQVTGSLVKPKNLSKEDEQHQNIKRQQSSYFCLQSQDDKWQFIGLDTAYHDSNPLNQINGLSLGPRLRNKQVDWFADKMQHFPGSTILLTHHQLFSIHDRICGSISQYRTFSCINPLLSAQLFKYLPVISCWYWGHEHALMFFKDDVMGVRKCRLLGNSSFHVFQKQGPYKRKKLFPSIPLIQQDQKYMHKYLPLNPQPDSKNPDCYYNLTYALIDMGKQKTNNRAIDQFTSTLTAEYYCCPCYSQQDKNKNHFKPYLLYQEEIQPRINTNIVTSQKFLKDQHSVVGNIHEITQSMELVMKSQIGLFVDRGVKLSLTGKKYNVVIQKSVNKELSEQAGLKFLQKKQHLLGKQEQKQVKQQKKTQQQQQNHQNNGQDIHKQQDNPIIKDQKKQQIIDTKKNEQKQKKLLLDGDIISFKQVGITIMKKNSTTILSPKMGQYVSQQSFSDKQLSNTNIKFLVQNKQAQNINVLQSHPKLQQITSIQSSTQLLPEPTQQLVDQVVSETINYKFFEGKHFEIKKSRILKDISLHIKLGDAFSLREVSSNQYLSCDIGVYGGMLKLNKLKQGENPCLFMFINDSLIK